MASYLARAPRLMARHETSSFTAAEKAELLVDPYELTPRCESLPLARRSSTLKGCSASGNIRADSLFIYRRIRSDCYHRRSLLDRRAVQPLRRLSSNSVSLCEELAERWAPKDCRMTPLSPSLTPPQSQSRRSSSLKQIFTAADRRSPLHRYHAASSEGLHSLPDRRHHRTSVRVLASHHR